MSTTEILCCSALSHAAIKTLLFVEHRLPIALRRALIAFDRVLRGYARVSCAPGNAYVFNGFVSLHHNLDVASGERRTLIIHDYDTGLASAARSTVRKLQALVDRAGYWF